MRLILIALCATAGLSAQQINAVTLVLDQAHFNPLGRTSWTGPGAIQQAVNAITAGAIATVRVPAGYSETLSAGIVIDSNASGLTLQADQGNLLMAGTDNINLIEVDGASNVKISGFNLAANGHVGLKFIYTSGANNIEVSDNTYTGDTYTAGTVTVTNGSTAITGSGTAWTSALVAGFMLVDNVYTPIGTITSATTGTLDFPYNGPTASGQNYQISYALGVAPEGTVISSLVVFQSVKQTGIHITHNRCFATGNCSVVWNGDEVLVEGDVANQITGDVAYSNVNLQTFPNGASYVVTNVRGNNLGRMGVEWQGSGYRWADVSHFSFQMGTASGYCVSDAGAGQSYGGAAPFGGTPTLVSVAGNAVTWVSGNDFSFLAPGQTVIIGGAPGAGLGVGGDIATITSNHALTLTAPAATQTGVLLSYDQSIGANISDGSCYAPLFSPSVPTGNSFGVEAYGHDVTISNVRNYGLNNLTGILFAGFNFKIINNSFWGAGSATVVYSDAGIEFNNNAGLDPFHDNLISGNTFTDMMSAAIDVPGGGTIISDNHDLRHPGYFATDSGQLYQSIVIGTADGPVTIKDNTLELGPPLNGFSLSSPGSFAWEGFVNDNPGSGTITFTGNKLTNLNATAFGTAITSNSGNFNGATIQDNTYTNLAAIELPGLSGQSIRYRNNKSLIGLGSGSPPYDFTTDGVPFATLPLGSGGAIGSEVVCGDCAFDVGGVATAGGSAQAVPVIWNGANFIGKPGFNEITPTCAGGAGVTCAIITGTPASNTAGIFSITTATGVAAGATIATITWETTNNDPYYQCFAYVAQQPATVSLTNAAGFGPGSTTAVFYIPVGGVALPPVTAAQLRYLCVHP